MDKPPAWAGSGPGHCVDRSLDGGVGPGLWLSQDNAPPAGMGFNIELAALYIWQWL